VNVGKESLVIGTEWSTPSIRCKQIEKVQFTVSESETSRIIFLRKMGSPTCQLAPSLCQTIKDDETPSTGPVLFVPVVRWWPAEVSKRPVFKIYSNILIFPSPTSEFVETVADCERLVWAVAATVKMLRKHRFCQDFRILSAAHTFCADGTARTTMYDTDLRIRLMPEAAI
jgi:hypothetical protein